MKKLLYICITTLLPSCNGNSVPDCFLASGAIIQKEVVVSEFTEIVVYDRVQLIVKEAPEQKVTVETGENLLDGISIKVEGDQLILKNNNSCNIARNYGLTKVYVSSPNITFIRSSTGLPVVSDGVLNYPEFKIFSDDTEEKGKYNTAGDFRMDLNCKNLWVRNNNISNMYLSGTAENMLLESCSGDSRFEGRNLIVQNIKVFHRSSNDMILNPQASITGEIRSTGNVILVNEPPVVDVKAVYKGRLKIE
ncbi:head GIN domain-containing protein [uncultured Gelidibacter sp.]|uniref:head GIN domain-containing protein n=1 Tax=uncultured Gelidibacter sp. TaxID=259318 RepID=UPI00261F60F7|nr:head GIN domain-containing protein [uncultured Gelidibacter sp.]